MSVGFLLSRDLVQSSQQERNPESVDRPAVYANWFVFRTWMFRQSSIPRYYTFFSANLHTTDVKTNLAIYIAIGFTTFFKQRCNVSKFMDATVYLLIMICWLKKHKSSDKTFAHSFRIRGDRPSSLGDLYTFKFFNSFSTSIALQRILESLWRVT